MVKHKTWEEFRQTGLFLFINGILHAFGWAITVEVDKEGKAIEGSAKPARVKFRGFDSKSSGESHLRISSYLKENADILYDEIREE